MLELYKTTLANQYEAAFCILSALIDRCPESAWNGLVSEIKFCQVAFHTLFYTDLYLGRSVEEMRVQPFHKANSQLFRDYEELEDKLPVNLYTKPEIKKYLEFCRQKVAHVLAAESEQSLAVTPGFPGRNFSRSELHVQSVRHIQNHAAQLNLILWNNHQIDIIWVSTGWRDI